MYKARVVLQPVEALEAAPLLELLAHDLGLAALDEQVNPDRSITTRIWRRSVGDAVVDEMHTTFDSDMQCNYLEFRGDTAQGVSRAVARAYAQLPVRMPEPLAQEAIANWRSRPSLLQCAALAVTDETEAALAQAIFEALCDADDSVWERAASAAALMPPTQSHWLVGTALATEQDETRRKKLERLMDYLSRSTGTTS